MMPKEPRVATGVPGLDEMLSGGFIPGSAVLLRGAPGCGKTSLSLQYLVHGARSDEPGLFISFEEFPASIHRDAESFGWNLSQLEEAGTLHLMFTSPQVLLDSLSSTGSSLSRLMLESGIKRVVLDSITHFTRLTDDSVKLRNYYNTVINALKREGVTSLLLGEESRSPRPQQERGKLSFVVDAIMLLRYVEVESAMQRAIVVLKMRGSDHAKEIRRVEITKNGVAVREPFSERENILTGISHKVSVPGTR
jgi:circadian clock protein KaiC